MKSNHNTRYTRITITDVDQIAVPLVIEDRNWQEIFQTLYQKAFNEKVTFRLLGSTTRNKNYQTWLIRPATGSDLKVRVWPDGIQPELSLKAEISILTRYVRKQTPTQETLDTLKWTQIESTMGFGIDWMKGSPGMVIGPLKGITMGYGKSIIARQQVNRMKRQGKKVVRWNLDGTMTEL